MTLVIKAPVSAGDIQTLIFKGTSRFPNNEVLPLVLYRNILQSEEPHAEESYEKLFAQNGWHRIWHGGIYGIDHYHSTAHEALGIASGTAQVRFGGETGKTLEVSQGDVLVIPAGVTHRRIAAGSHLMVVGCYPEGQEPNICYGYSDSRAREEQEIAMVPLPATDPIIGHNGPLLELWVPAS